MERTKASKFLAVLILLIGIWITIEAGAFWFLGGIIVIIGIIMLAVHNSATEKSDRYQKIKENYSLILFFLTMVFTNLTFGGSGRPPLAFTNPNGLQLDLGLLLLSFFVSLLWYKEGVKGITYTFLGFLVLQILALVLGGFIGTLRYGLF